jgi:phosphoglycolate phosphatase
MKLFLFDLDGTLVNTGGAGMRALVSTFKSLHGLTDVLAQVDPSGKTDPAIFREILRVFLNREMSPDNLKEISGTYLSLLVEEVANSPNYKILPGVHSFLNFLSIQRDVTVGLGTGNLEDGARIKLDPSGLNPYFLFGAFGSDSEDRTALLRMGRERAQVLCEDTIEDKNVFVVGDTELDIAAARAAGFKSVAVSTGSRQKDELMKAKPNYFLSDLTEGRTLMNSLRDPSEVTA